MMLTIEVIAATRLDENRFWCEAPLGLSLKRLMADKISLSLNVKANLTFNNKSGLPQIYNARINAPDSSDYLVFIHDDIWILDLFFDDKIHEGLSVYDVIGVAGNKRRVEKQPGWIFIDDQFTWDHPDNLSGRIRHLHPLGEMNTYGKAPAECELLDGCFLAAKKSTLVENNVLFDPLFNFQFYDMDFCRTARQKQLRLGTWPISLGHQSAGAFGSTLWKQKLAWYRAKWND